MGHGISFAFLVVALISGGSVLLMLWGVVEVFIQLFERKPPGIVFFKDTLAEKMEKALRFERWKDRLRSF